MKLIFFCLSLLISNCAFCQDKEVTKRDSLVKVLDSIDLEQFEKKKTSHFVSRIPSNYEVEIVSSNNFNYPYTAILTFPDRPYVEVRLLYERLAHTNPNSICRRKIRKQFKREKIEKVQLYDEYQCIKGCDD